MTTPAPVSRVALEADGLLIVELADDAARQRAAASHLATQLARCLLEFLQHQRSRTTLSRVVHPEVETSLVEWRRLLDWGSARLVAAHGAVVDERAMEGSFSLSQGRRRLTFTVRMQHDGHQWTCVHLAPVGLLVAVRSSPHD